MDKRELNSEELYQVTGGIGNWLYTVEDIENSPVFEGLKNMIALAKSRNDLSNPEYMKELELKLALFAKAARNGRYRFTIETCREFIKKYLPLV